MAEEKKDGDGFDIADTVDPAANYAVPKNFFNFEGLVSVSWNYLLQLPKLW
jgi:hypothetical protein